MKLAPIVVAVLVMLADPALAHIPKECHDERKAWAEARVQLAQALNAVIMPGPLPPAEEDRRMVKHHDASVAEYTGRIAFMACVMQQSSPVP